MESSPESLTQNNEVNNYTTLNSLSNMQYPVTDTNCSVMNDAFTKICKQAEKDLIPFTYNNRTDFFSKLFTIIDNLPYEKVSKINWDELFTDEKNKEAITEFFCSHITFCKFLNENKNFIHYLTFLKYCNMNQICQDELPFFIHICIDSMIDVQKDYYDKYDFSLTFKNGHTLISFLIQSLFPSSNYKTLLSILDYLLWNKKQEEFASLLLFPSTQTSLLQPLFTNIKISPSCIISIHEKLKQLGYSSKLDWENYFNIALHSNCSQSVIEIINEKLVDSSYALKQLLEIHPEKTTTYLSKILQIPDIKLDALNNLDESLLFILMKYPLNITTLPKIPDEKQPDMLDGQYAAYPACFENNLNTTSYFPILPNEKLVPSKNNFFDIRSTPNVSCGLTQSPIQCTSDFMQSAMKCFVEIISHDIPPQVDPTIKDCIKQILQNPTCIPNVCDINGDSPLFYALQKNESELALDIIHSPAFDINFKYDDDTTPMMRLIDIIMHMTFNKSNEIYLTVFDDMLKNTSLDLTQKDINGLSVIAHACSNDNSVILKRMLRSNISVKSLYELKSIMEQRKFLVNTKLIQEYLNKQPRKKYFYVV